MSRVLPGASLHVLLTADVVGGVWDFCRVLAAELIRQDHRVTLLAFGVPTPEHRRQAARLGATLLDASLKLEWMEDSEADVHAAGALIADLVGELRPDVVHLNQYGPARTEYGVPVVLTAHSDVLSWRKWALGESPADCAVGWDGYAALVRDGLQTADRTVAVSRFLAGELRELYRLERDVAVIHNGWPVSDGDVRPIRDRPRLTVLAGRAWDIAKNVDLAADAAHGWPAVGRVVLAGEQRHPETGRPRELGPDIIALGRLSREELDRLLGFGRIYLAPARYEPFGLLPVQAALAGCALLLADIPSFRELWSGAALFFRSDDPADLRRQWARVLEDDALAADLAGAARARARNRYDSARMAAEYAAVYAELLADRHRAGRAPASSVGTRALVGSPTPVAPVREHG